MSRYLRPTPEMNTKIIESGMDRGRQLRSDMLLDLIRRLWHAEPR
jgi:hypothetical protein